SQLRIRVSEARNLPALDWGGTSDPYVIARFEGQTKKTSTIFKTLHPRWNEILVFPTSSSTMDTSLGIECFDHDFGSKDDSCGRVDIDLLGFSVGETVCKWYPLKDY
ncbi:hypothetical protein GUITHDRAFT_40140, partial [Guillardia theta CCMP2712]